MSEAVLTAPKPGDRSEFAYLELLARVKKALDSATEIRVPVSDIRPFPGQPRTYFNQDSIRRLSESIDAGGQTTSGMIRKNPTGTEYELIDGERRWRAIKRIPEERRPLYRAKLIEADDDVVQFLISGMANFNRENHTPLEVMETIDRFLTFGLPMKEVADLLGISMLWAYQMHGLKKLGPKVRAFLAPNLPKAERLPVTAAIQISKIEEQLQLGLASRVIAKQVPLGRLRGEVMKAAREAGSHVRTREVSPRHRWESFGNKLGVAKRAADDAESLAKSEDIRRFITSRPHDAEGLLRTIQDARESLSEIESLIRQARK